MFRRESQENVEDVWAESHERFDNPEEPNRIGTPVVGGVRELTF